VTILFNVSAHRTACFADAMTPLCFRDCGHNKGVAQDANIGISVSSDAIEVEIAA